MTQLMKELLLREIARGIAAVAKRHDIYIDPIALLGFLYKNISLCKLYKRPNDKLYIGYDGMLLYKLKELAKTPEEAEKLTNYNIACEINYRPHNKKPKPPKLVVEFQFLNPSISTITRAFNGSHKLSNTFCTMYTNIDGTERSLFTSFICRE